MVLRERAKKQINTYSQQPPCVNVPQILNIESSIRFTARTMNSHDIVPYYIILCWANEQHMSVL